MFYKINNKYYILVGSIYTEVHFETKSGDVRAIPTSNTIEKTPKVKAKEITFEDVKKEVSKSKESFDDSFDKTRGGKRERYSRLNR